MMLLVSLAENKGKVTFFTPRPGKKTNKTKNKHVDTPYRSNKQTSKRLIETTGW